MKSFLFYAFSFFLLALLPNSNCFADNQAEIDQIPNKNAYIKKLLSEATAKGEKSVTLKPGVYRISEALEFKKIKDIDLIAKDVTLLMTQPGEAMRIDKCHNFSIRGLTIDFDPIPFTQATITSISPDQKTLEFEIHKGYPKLTNKKGETTFSKFSNYPRHYFDKTTRLWKKEANYFEHPMLDVVDGLKGQAVFDDPQQGVSVGDYMTFDRRRINQFAAVSIRGTTGTLLLEDVTIRASYGLTFAGRWIEGPSIFRRVKIERGPRPAGATEDRLLSSNADGMNFAHCRQGPTIDNCDFGFMGDDGLNVHGRFIVILKVVSPTELLLLHPSKPESLVEMSREGDAVRFMEEGTFGKVGEAPLKSISVVEKQDGLTQDEITKACAGYADLAKRDENKNFTVFNMKLAAPISFAKAGQWIDIPAINCPNFVVKNSYFHDHRGRGLRLMADNGLVEGNRFERIGSAAIQVGPELNYWREAGWVNHLIIRNNQIRDLGFADEFTKINTYVPGAIAVCARVDKMKPPYAADANDNILIENNIIEGCPVGAVYAYGAKNISILNNKAKQVGRELPLKNTNKYGLNPKKAFDYEWIPNVKDEGNTIE